MFSTSSTITEKEKQIDSFFQDEFIDDTIDDSETYKEILGSDLSPLAKMMRTTALKRLQELLSIKHVKINDFVAQLQDGKILLVVADLLIEIRRDVFRKQIVRDSCNSDSGLLDTALERLKANSEKQEFAASLSPDAIQSNDAHGAFKLLYGIERAYRKEWSYALAESRKRRYLLDTFQIHFPVEVCKESFEWINSTLQGKYARLETLLDLQKAFSSEKFWTSLASTLTGVSIESTKDNIDNTENTEMHRSCESVEDAHAKEHISLALSHFKEHGCDLYLSANDIMNCHVKMCAFVCKLLRLSFMANIMLLKIGKPVVIREPDFYASEETKLINDEELESVEAQLDALLLSEDGHSPEEEQTIEALLNKEKELLTAQQSDMLTTLSGSLLKRISTQDNYSPLEIASSAKLSLDRLDELVSTVEQEMLYNYQVQSETIAQSTPPLQSSIDSSASSDSSKCKTKAEMISDSSTKECVTEAEPAVKAEHVPTQDDIVSTHSLLASSPSLVQNESAEQKSSIEAPSQSEPSQQEESKQLLAHDNVPMIACSTIPNKKMNTKAWVYSSPSKKH